MPLPDHLVRPLLSDEAEIYHEAFMELSSDRQTGYVAGPIPFTAIDRYAERFGFSDPDEFRTLLDMIRVQDAEFRRIVNKPQKKPGE